MNRTWYSGDAVTKKFDWTRLILDNFGGKSAKRES
jgi:hypothetical protein